MNNRKYLLRSKCMLCGFDIQHKEDRMMSLIIHKPCRKLLQALKIRRAKTHLRDSPLKKYYQLCRLYEVSNTNKLLYIELVNNKI